MDIPALRSILRPIIGSFKDCCTNALIPQYCADLGLPVPDDVGSKRDRWHAAFDALDEKDLPRLGQRLVDTRQLSPRTRNEVQDILWSDEPVPAIPKRHRRDIARALQPLEHFHHWDNFTQLLKDIFVVQEPAIWISLPGAPLGTLEEVHRRFIRNPEDANV